jgi:hypothetical protein
MRLALRRPFGVSGRPATRREAVGENPRIAYTELTHSDPGVLAVWLSSEAAASMTATTLAMEDGWTQQWGGDMDVKTRDDGGALPKPITLAVQGGGTHGAIDGILRPSVRAQRQPGHLP